MHIPPSPILFPVQCSLSVCPIFGGSGPRGDGTESLSGFDSATKNRSSTSRRLSAVGVSQVHITLSFTFVSKGT